MVCLRTAQPVSAGTRLEVTTALALVGTDHNSRLGTSETSRRRPFVRAEPYAPTFPSVGKFLMNWISTLFFSLFLVKGGISHWEIPLVMLCLLAWSRNQKRRGRWLVWWPWEDCISQIGALVWPLKLISVNKASILCLLTLPTPLALHPNTPTPPHPHPSIDFYCGVIDGRVGVNDFTDIDGSITPMPPHLAFRCHHRIH